MGLSSHGASRGQVLRNAKPDLRRVQPPDAENRTSGGVEGSRGAIPVSPSDPAICGHDRPGRERRLKPPTVYSQSAPANTPTERRGYNLAYSRIVATSLCRGAVVPSAPANTPTERRGYNLAYSRFVATSLCRGDEVPSAPANTPTERRGYNLAYSRFVATSLCRGDEVPSAPANTPTERRGYNLAYSRFVATSLCRGAVVPSAPANTPTERRGYNLAYSRFVATSLCRGDEVPKRTRKHADRAAWLQRLGVVHSVQQPSCRRGIGFGAEGGT
jgi:hypothetical protein